MTQQAQRAELNYLFSLTGELRRLASTMKRGGGHIAAPFQPETTILRDWRAAQAWLAHTLRQ